MCNYNIDEYNVNEYNMFIDNDLDRELHNTDNNIDNIYDLSNISPGDIYTYKELTEKLSLKYYKGGNGKIKQLDDLSRYMSISKRGYKYLIKEIYDEPIEKLPEFPPKFSKNDKYTENIMNILALYIYSQNKNVVYLTLSDIAFICGFYNQSFKDYKYNYQALAEKLNITQDEVEEFYNHACSYANTTIRRVLDVLEDKRVINFYKTFLIYPKIDPSGYNIHNVNIEPREALQWEVEFILDCEAESLKGLGVNAYSELRFLKNGYIRYWAMVHELVAKKYPDWFKWSPVYKITTTQNVISQLANEIISNESKYKINDQMFEYLYNQANRLYMKAYELNRGDIDPADPNNIWYSIDHYSIPWLDHQLEITDTVIPI